METRRRTRKRRTGDFFKDDDDRTNDDSNVAPVAAPSDAQVEPARRHRRRSRRPIQQNEFDKEHEEDQKDDADAHSQTFREGGVEGSFDIQTQRNQDHQVQKNPNASDTNVPISQTATDMRHEEENNSILHSISTKTRQGGSEMDPLVSEFGLPVVTGACVTSIKRFGISVTNGLSRAITSLLRLSNNGLHPLASRPIIPFDSWRNELQNVRKKAAEGLLAIHVVGCTRPLQDPYVMHPLIRIHIVDETTGRYLRKPKWCLSKTSDSAVITYRKPPQTASVAISQALSNFCSGQKNLNFVRKLGNADFVAPHTTSPAISTSPQKVNELGSDQVVRVAGDVAPVWDETVIFHEELELFLQPGVLVLFELVEWGPAVPGLAFDDSTYKISWGFFRPVSLDGRCFVDTRARIQLPPQGSTEAKRQAKHRLKVASSSELTTKAIQNASHELTRQIPSRATNGPTELTGGVNIVSQLCTLSDINDIKPSRSTYSDKTHPSSRVPEYVAASDNHGLGLAYNLSNPQKVGSKTSRHSQPDTLSQSTLLRPPVLQIQMYKYQTVSKAVRRAHAATVSSSRVIRKFYADESFDTQDNNTAKPDDIENYIGPCRSLECIPAPDVFLQYRLTKRENVSYTLAVQLASAAIPEKTRDTRGQVSARSRRASQTSGYTSEGGASIGAQLHPEKRRHTGRINTAARHRRSDKERKTQSKTNAKEDPSDIWVQKSIMRQRRARDACELPDTHLVSLHGGSIGALCLSFSPNGKYLAVACTDENAFPIRIYDTVYAQQKFSLTGHSALVHTIEWREDSAYIASASQDGTTRVWCLLGNYVRMSANNAAASSQDHIDNSDESHEPVCISVLQHRPPVYTYTVAWHPKAPWLLLSGSYDCRIRLWESGAHSTLFNDSSVSSSLQNNSALVLSENSKEDEHIGQRRTILRNARRGSLEEAAMALVRAKRRSSLHGNSDNLMEYAAENLKDSAMKFGINVNSATSDSLAGCLGVIGGSLKKSPRGSQYADTSEQRKPIHHAANVNSITFGNKGQRMFSGDAEGIIVVWDTTGKPYDPESYQVLKRVSHPSLRNSSITSLRMRPNRNQLLVFAQGGICRLFDTTPVFISPMRNFSGAHCTKSNIKACFSPDGRYVLAGSEDGECCIWETDTGTLVEGSTQTFGDRSSYILGYGKSAAVNGVSWHPTEHLIALSTFGSGNPVVLFAFENAYHRHSGQ